MVDQTPRTEAGRRLLAIWENDESHRDAILAIEAQARTEAALLDAIAHLPYLDHKKRRYVERVAVEALLRGPSFATPDMGDSEAQASTDHGGPR